MPNLAQDVIAFWQQDGAVTDAADTAGKRILQALVVPAAGFALWLAWQAAWGPDWPAQLFRAWLARHVGYTVWSNAWYSGDAIISYSVLYPVFALGLSAALIGVLAVGATSLAAVDLAPTGSRWRAVGFHLSVTVVLLAALMIGQVPFLAGIAFGSWALRAVATRKGFLAFLLAAACALTSPIAGAFLIISLPGLAVALGWRTVLPLISAVLGPAAAIVFGGVGGTFPFAQASLIEISIFCVAALVVSRNAAAQVWVLTYLVVSLVSFAIANPVGGDVARLGELVALPLVWHLLPTMRGGRGAIRIAFAAVLLAAAAAWQIYPAASAASRGMDDPSQNRLYYAGLLHYLSRQDPRRGRLEVVFTREHWESYWVARAFPIARGWERQTDDKVSGVLYHPLTAADYYRWLKRNAVTLVALPDVPIDYGGQAEATLLRHPPSYLRPVYHDAHWRVWRVVHPSVLVSGPARMRSLGTASFTLEFRRRGEATVRIHGSDLWQVTHGSACVRTNPGGWIVVRARKPGRVALNSRLSLDAVIGKSPSGC